MWVQKCKPLVVFNDPMSVYVGKHMIARTMPKAWKLSPPGMFVMPKTEVTKVRGRKKMVTRVRSLMLCPCWTVIVAC